MDLNGKNGTTERTATESTPYPRMFDGEQLGRGGGDNHVERAYNVNVGPNHGVIHQTVTVQHRGEPDVATLLKNLNPVFDASHTRNLKLSPPNSRCFPKTREQFIAMVVSWAKADLNRNGPHILWIYGYAGCGKSAISQVVAEQLAEDGILAASFFFFRGAGDRCRISRLLTTIASQIIAEFPEAVTFIEEAIRRKPSLLSTTTSSLKHQFKLLVWEPIKAISASLGGPVSIVLDGFDECEDRDEVATFIADAITHFEQEPLIPLRLVIASRVEDHIHRELHASPQVHLLNLVDYTSDKDIATALDVSIEKQKRGRVMVSDPSWPPLEDRRKLVEHIGGSFIFMTTIVRLLFSPSTTDGLTPMERLPGLLRMKAEFDGLYMEILQPCAHFPSFLDILSTIALAFQPLSISEIGDLLGIQPSNVVNTLIHLHSIMQIPDDDRTPITLWHSSLRDFLCTQARSKGFYASPRHHRSFAIRAVRVAASDHPSPSQGYSQRYAINHLSEVADTEGDTELFNGEGSSIVSLLDKPVFWFEATTKLTGKATIKLTGLEVACRARRWRLVRTLLSTQQINLNVHITGVPVDRSHHSTFTTKADVALTFACRHRQLDVIYLLLDKGADPNVAANEQDRSWKAILPLSWAVNRHDVALVKKLLACGASTCRQHLLICAQFFKGDVIASILLEHGADVNARGYLGRTPLHYACGRGDIKLVECLLKFDADPNIQGTFPFHCSSTSIDLNTTDYFGDIPLHDACVRNSVAAAECVLNHKTDASIRSERGETALQVSRRLGKLEVVEMFARRGITE